MGFLDDIMTGIEGQGKAPAAPATQAPAAPATPAPAPEAPTQAGGKRMHDFSDAFEKAYGRRT